MIIDCISDLHGVYPELEGGDLLIIAGDIGNDSLESWNEFNEWIFMQPYTKKIIIAGNHDSFIQISEAKRRFFSVGCYLQDSMEEFKGLKIWGSPWTKRFPGMNPHCMAFTVETDEELKQKWALIPEDVNILVTHSPPLGFMDEVWQDHICERQNVGSRALYSQLYTQRIQPQLHVFGHVHEGYGKIDKILDMPGVTMVNASLMNEDYEPVNKPIRIIL